MTASPVTLHRARYLLPITAPLLEDGALLVAGARLLAVGTSAELAGMVRTAKVVDHGESVILPPLVNAHTHLELTHFPRWAAAAGEGAPPPDFVGWIERMIRVRRALSTEEVGASLADGLQASLRAGTGAVGDILTTLAAAGGYQESPLFGTVFCEVLGVDSGRVSARLAEILSLLGQSPAARLRWGLSPHAPYTMNGATLDRAAEFAAGHRLPLAGHWRETAEEEAFLAEAAGPLAERLYPLAGWPLPSAPVPWGTPAAYPPGSLLIHGVHAGGEDVAGLASRGHRVVLCPRSNSLFGAARAPLAAYLRQGVPLALGTDSLASAPSLSVWEELAFARQWYAGILAPDQWLAIATHGGASALGAGALLGALEAGRGASFQVVGLPAGATAASLGEALVTAGETLEVRELCLGGVNALPAA